MWEQQPCLHAATDAQPSAATETALSSFGWSNLLLDFHATCYKPKEGEAVVNMTCTDVQTSAFLRGYNYDVLKYLPLQI